MFVLLHSKAMEFTGLLWDCSSDFGRGMCVLLFEYSSHIRTHNISGNYQEREVVCLGLECFVFRKEESVVFIERIV